MLKAKKPYFTFDKYLAILTAKNHELDAHKDSHTCPWLSSRLQLVLKKLNSKLLTNVIKNISWVWNVILSSHPFSIMEKTQIIAFSVILDILTASLLFHAKLRQK